MPNTQIIKLGVTDYDLRKADMTERAELNLTLVIRNNENMTPQNEAEAMLAVMKALSDNGVNISTKE